MNVYVLIAAFLASTVEFVEAFSVVLAVGLTKGWASAAAGVTIALVLLTGAGAVLGETVLRLPLDILQLVLGLLLLLFGLRWLQKAVRRAAGQVAPSDEARSYATAVSGLRQRPAAGFLGLDIAGFAAGFGGVLVEGLEVVFTVVTLGASSGSVPSALAGAVGGLAFVSLLAVLFHRPLTRVPENTIKFGVGLLLTTLGTFFAG